MQLLAMFANRKIGFSNQVLLKRAVGNLKNSINIKEAGKKRDERNKFMFGNGTN